MSHYCKCGKAKQKGKKLCDECREKAIKIHREKNDANAPKRMAEHRKTPEYREWLEAQYPKPEFKARIADNQRRYLATPQGRLRSNFLHYRQKHPEVTFEQYTQQIAKVSLELPTLIKVLTLQ